MLLVFGLLTGAATASSAALRGTYKATITGKPAALNGRWKLEFKARGVFHLVRNGHRVVAGTTARVGPRRIKFRDRSGSYACSAAERNGTYRYTFVGKRLVFVMVADKCVGRRLVLTTKSFVK